MLRDVDLRNQISTYKKMGAIRDEIVKGNDYFFSETLSNVRTLFRFRVDLIEAKLNFKQKYKHESLLCNSCESQVENNTHILFCPSYISLREGKSMNNNQHLAEYIQQVLEIRSELRLNR